jgi:hypothetical protein
LNLADLIYWTLQTELGISSYLRFLHWAIYYTGSEGGKLIILSIKYTQVEAGWNPSQHIGTH